MDSLPIVYFAVCVDLVRGEWTKIGSCKNWVDRLSTYKTSYPLRNIRPYCMVFTKYHTLIETIFKKEFVNVSSTTHEDFENGGTEWITKTLTLYDVQNVLQKHPSIEYELLHGDDLEKYLEGAERKACEKALEEQKKKNTEYEEYLVLCEKEQEEQKDTDGQFPFTLRGYQVDTKVRIIRHYQHNNRCVVNWACGLGKTILALCVVYLYKKVLIGVPSVLLVRQWVRCIQQYFLQLEILVITSSYVDGVTNTTDKEYVNEWELGKKQYVIITTYHSSSVVQHLKFDLKVLDECHHLCQVCDDSKFYKILHIESEKQLALTATLKAIDDDQKVDNFDKESFGEIIDIRSTLWAIENKYITDYEVITVRVEETTLCNIMADVLGLISHQEIFLAAFVMLESMTRCPDLTHIIAYCNTCDSADLLNSFISKLLGKRFGKLKNNFYHKALDSESLKNTKLDMEVKTFEESPMGIISSVYIFGEGLDIPKVNGVCVVENMLSEIRIVQSVMRGNRLEKDNPDKINRMILPYIENEQNTFEKVETVITKMGNQDANIEQRIRACVIGAGGVNGGEAKYNVDFNDVKELDHVKLKLRHRSVLRLPGASRIKSQYMYLRSLNILHGVNSRRDYFSNPRIKHERLDDPPQYFENKDPTVWRSWYDFLGIDLSVFPSTKDKWRAKCKKHTITSSNYSTQWEQFGLPEHPDDLYRDFKTIRAELGEKKNRRFKR